jgi:hypothetical protein
MILALLLAVGIGSAAITVVGNYCIDNNTSYDWTLTKTANVTDLTYNSAPDNVARSVLFTINITKTAPYSQVVITSDFTIYNSGSTDVTITEIHDYLQHYYFANYPVDLLVIPFYPN